jgi:hypothetical protein
MTPSRFHVPLRPSGALHREIDGPPAASIFFSLPSAKYPTLLPSGDQKR